MVASPAPERAAGPCSKYAAKTKQQNSISKQHTTMTNDEIKNLVEQTIESYEMKVGDEEVQDVVDKVVATIEIRLINIEAAIAALKAAVGASTPAPAGRVDAIAQAAVKKSKATFRVVAKGGKK